MNLIVTVGTSLSAAAIAVGFAIVADRTLSRENTDTSTRQPTPVMPSRIAPDLTPEAATPMTTAIQDTAVTTSPAPFLHEPDTETTTEGDALTLAHTDSSASGPSFPPAPEAAENIRNTTGPATDPAYRDNAILSPNISTAGPGTIYGTRATTEALVIGMPSVKASPKPAPPFEPIPAWRFQNLPLIGVYR
ncbi:MAG: hypothetical protein ACK5II_14535 [Paracoccus sp. (in: a-proteobacteria)]